MKAYSPVNRTGPPQGGKAKEDLEKVTGHKADAGLESSRKEESGKAKEDLEKVTGHRSQGRRWTGIFKERGEWKGQGRPGEELSRTR